MGKIIYQKKQTSYILNMFAKQFVFKYLSDKHPLTFDNHYVLF